MKMQNPGVAPGIYQAWFRGTREFSGEYGAGLRWIFEVASGPKSGEEASRITSESPTPANACGRMLSALAGRTLAVGEEFDPKIVEGQRYTIEVCESKSGPTRVESVTPRLLGPGGEDVKAGIQF